MSLQSSSDDAECLFSFSASSTSFFVNHPIIYFLHESWTYFETLGAVFQGSYSDKECRCGLPHRVCNLNFSSQLVCRQAGSKNLLGTQPQFGKRQRLNCVIAPKLLDLILGLYQLTNQEGGLFRITDEFATA